MINQMTAAGTDGALILGLLTRFTNITVAELITVSKHSNPERVYDLLNRMKHSKLVEREFDHDRRQWRYALGPRAPQRVGDS